MNGKNWTDNDRRPGTLVAFRWSGSRWVPVHMPHPQATSWPAIAIGSASDIWMSMTGPDRQTVHELHWNGHVWQMLTVPASMYPAWLYVMPDGHGGAWLGSGVHWTGSSWILVNFVAPPGLHSGTESGLVAKVPGAAASYWEGGSINGHPEIYLNGPVP